MTTINVIDSIMGSGKTSWAIQYMNEASPLEKFIYITPYLDEVKRIRENTVQDFFEPNNNNREGSKMRSLKELIADGKDIVSTHSLFQMADDELYELLSESGYTLVLDEVMDVIEKAKVTERDIRDLLELGHIEVDSDNHVIWNCVDYDTNAKYADIMKLAKAGTLFYFKNTFLVWAFPPRIFETFIKVYVMTYLFKGQMQCYYFQMYEFDFEYHAVEREGGKYKLVDYDTKKENRQELYSLINVYDGKKNDIGKDYYAFSASKLRNLSADRTIMTQRAIYGYFRNDVKAKAKEIIWTTIKDAKSELSGKGYARSFLQCNARATNEYRDRWALAYVFNRFMNPIESTFFQDNHVDVDEDLLAVSELLQWIYRSRIRNGEPIELYLPSSRMRTLLKQWANYEI